MHVKNAGIGILFPHTDCHRWSLIPFDFLICFSSLIHLAKPLTHDKNHDKYSLYNLARAPNICSSTGLPLFGFIREHLDYAQNFVKNFVKYFIKMKWHSREINPMPILSVSACVLVQWCDFPFQCGVEMWMAVISLARRQFAPTKS